MNDQPTPNGNYGVYALRDNSGNVKSYVDRPVVNNSFGTPLVAFDHPAYAFMAATKLNNAGEKFGKWVSDTDTAIKLLDTDLYPKPQPIAYVICYRTSSYRHLAPAYILREWTDVDADDLLNGEPDRSIIFEATDYEQAVEVRKMLNREFALNGTHARTLADVLNILKEYVVEEVKR